MSVEILQTRLDSVGSQEIGKKWKLKEEVEDEGKIVPVSAYQHAREELDK